MPGKVASKKGEKKATVKNNTSKDEDSKEMSTSTHARTYTCDDRLPFSKVDRHNGSSMICVILVAGHGVLLEREIQVGELQTLHATSILYMTWHSIISIFSRQTHRETTPI